MYFLVLNSLAKIHKNLEYSKYRIGFNKKLTKNVLTTYKA